MLKCLFVVVLLQVCYSFQQNINLNKEIFDDLQNLGRIVKLPEFISVPGKFMLDHPEHCVGTFSGELRNLLANVTLTTGATEENQAKNQLKRLELNLLLLGGQQNDTHCTTQITKGKHYFLNRYTTFIRKLNNKKIHQ